MYESNLFTEPKAQTLGQEQQYRSLNELSCGKLLVHKVLSCKYWIAEKHILLYVDLDAKNIQEKLFPRN